MTLIDTIRLGGETADKAKALCKVCDYDPNKIGSMILKACGYDVDQHHNEQVNKENRKNS